MIYLRLHKLSYPQIYLYRIICSLLIYLDFGKFTQYTISNILIYAKF